MTIDKYTLYERYIENPEELDNMLLKILTPDAYRFVFNFLAEKMSELDLFEIKFALAVFYVNRGYPRPNAPLWTDVVDDASSKMPQITKEGVIKIIKYIRREKEIRRREELIKKIARRVDDFFFMKTN